MSKKSKSKKVVLIVSLIAILALLGVSIWYFSRPKKTANLEASEAVKKSGEQAEVDSAKTSDNKNSNQGQQSSQQSTATASKPTVNITNAAQQGSVVVINALVSGATSGSCNVTLSNGSIKIQKSAPVGFQVSYYICQGFSINSSEFNPKGEWTATIDVTTPNGTAQSEPRKVTIQ
jgi:cytoskeletal protein RodZ